MQYYKMCKSYVQTTMHSVNMIFLLNTKNKVQSGNTFLNVTCHELSYINYLSTLQCVQHVRLQLESITQKNTVK